MLPWRLGLVSTSHSLDERHSIALSRVGLWILQLKRVQMSSSGAAWQQCGRMICSDENGRGFESEQAGKIHFGSVVQL